MPPNSDKTQSNMQIQNAIKSRKILTFSISLSLALFGPRVFAQSKRPEEKPPAKNAEAINKGRKASLEGSITDLLTDKPLAEAIVVVTRKGGAEHHDKFETEADGKFNFADLDPGDYTVTASAPGKFSTSQSFKLENAEKKILTLALEDRESTDILRVTGKRTLIHPEKIGSSTNLNKRFLEQYKSGNNLTDVIVSTPGIMRDSFGNIITRGEHNAVNYEMDGAILPETNGALNQAQFANPRSLQSVDVDIGGYEARDGGGPLGAVVRMKSLPIEKKPTLKWGGQLGGPLAGSLYYYASTALSQNPKSKLAKIKVESTGNAVPTSLGLAPPVKHFVRNGRLDLNFLNKIEYQATENDKFILSSGINETFLQIPTSGSSASFGVKQREHDRQDYIILTYKRKGTKWIDEADLHIINAFYSQTLRGTNVFDPYPIINGEEPQLVSVAPRAFRRNYVLSLQGNAKKQVRKTHNLQAGFLAEFRPVRTRYSATYRNAGLQIAADTLGGYQQAQREAGATAAEEFLAGVFQTAFDDAIAGGATEEDAAAAGDLAVAGADIAAQQTALAAANAVPNTSVPYGAIISPFTGLPGGPQFDGNLGKYNGFRFLQSAYFQDTYKPDKGVWKRLTLNAGVRADCYHGVFGNTLRVAQAIASIPGVEPFLLAPFQTQKVTNAQASGRFGASVVVTKNTVLRGSYSDLFQPPPVDVFSTPPLVSEGTINGIFNGTVRPLQATRGRMVDCSLETQIGPRFVTRTNLFYKQLKNFGDSGVVLNTPLYNRLTLAAQEAYGVETRIDLKPNKDGYGFNGFLSNSIAIAKLRGSKGVTGGIYEIEDGPSFAKYPDHDRRFQLQAGFGYLSRKNFWCLAELGVLSGLQDGRAPELFGAHPARTPFLTLLGFNAGYKLPKEIKARKGMPSGIDLRIENILNQRVPINLGSPYQGTRYQLPLRVLVGLNWQV